MSIEEIIQKNTRANELAEIVVITSKVREGDFRKAMDSIRILGLCENRVSAMLRVYRAE